MTYVTSQNPGTNYSNSQNPPSPYSNNQNPAPPAPRVAQANTAASKSKMPSDKEILEILFPSEMKTVDVKNYNGQSGVPSELVKDYGFAAWTNSKDEIYLNELIPGIDGFLRIYVLYHEGLHIRQFIDNSNSRPTSFQDMLKFEILAYGKAVAWFDSKQAESLKKKIGTPESEFRDLVRTERINVTDVFRVGDKAMEAHISKLNEGLSASEIDQIYLEKMISCEFKDKDEKVVKTMSLLPNKFIDKGLTKRYSIDDLYDKTNKTFYSVP